MIKWIVAFMLCFMGCGVLTAQIIQGTVVDGSQKPITLASVQLLDSETSKLISYGQTDSNGVFSLALKGNTLPLQLKIAHIAFLSKTQIIQTTDVVEVVLEPREEQLKEIVIKAKQFDVEEINDTLRYNLKNLLNGSELKLKDVIEKLPGLSIDDNGKIRFRGQVINHLLLDGDEFFGDKHQIANENITAEMIEKIEMLTNYQDFSTIKGFESSGVTALNIGLNEKFRNTVKGDVALQGGVEDSYKSHNNLYNFASEHKWNLITDLNNVNYNVISFQDYLGLRKITGKKIIQQQNTESESISDEELPPFLFSKDDINTKDIKNYTLNLTSKINKKQRIEFVSILNHIRQTEKQQAIQTFFGAEDLEIIKSDNIYGSSLFSSNFFKYENKFSAKTHLKVNAYALLTHDQQEQSIHNQIVLPQQLNLFEDNLKNKNNKFGANAIYKTSVSDKVLMEGIIFADYGATNIRKNLFSDTAFIGFDYDQNQIHQQSNLDVFSSGLSGRVTFKQAKGSWVFQLRSLWDVETFENLNVLAADYSFSDSFTKNSNAVGVNYNSKFFKDKLRYTVGVDMVNNNHRFDGRFNNNQQALLPNISTTLQLNSKWRITSVYNQTLKEPSIYNFLTGNIIEDYRTELRANNLVSEKVRTDNYQVGLTHFNVPKNIISILSILHSNGSKDLGKTFTNSSQTTMGQYDYLGLNRTTSVMYVFEKKWQNFPFGINMEALSLSSETNTFVNEVPSTNELSRNKVNFKIKSYFKNSGFNFNVGVEYINAISENRILTTTSKSTMVNTSPYLRFNGLVFREKLHWEFNSNYHMFKSTIVESNNILDLGFKLNYTYNTACTLFLESSNFLNIRKDNTKNNFSYNTSFAEERIMNTLSGYINVGFSYSF